MSYVHNISILGHFWPARVAGIGSSGIMTVEKCFSVFLVHLSLSILITKCETIIEEFKKASIHFVPFDQIHFRRVCIWKLLLLTAGVVMHDVIYQFLRIFYHSRFKPDNLQMTLSQWAMPIVDLIFLLGPIIHIKRLIISTKKFNLMLC